MIKELIIIIYKINVDGLSRRDVSEVMSDLSHQYCLSQDEDLKDNYKIREIYLPTNGETDVKVIYPIAGNIISNESQRLIEEINTMISDDSSNTDMKNKWEQLMRELKLKIIQNNDN